MRKSYLYRRLIMNDDFRFVYRKETFNDFAVREIASTQAFCLCRLQFGRCKEYECARCSTHKEIIRCHSQLSDYDRLRLKKYTSQEYIRLSAHPQMWMNFSRNIRFFIFSIIFFAFILFIVYCYLSNMPSEKPISKEYDSMIIENIIYTQNHIYDYNKDGLINCIDYSTLFKVNWDSKYPNIAEKCSILRNKNPTNKFHHLFVEVNGCKIEPWASNPYKYLMNENWSSRKYNPVYDIRGETNKWLMTAN